MNVTGDLVLPRIDCCACTLYGSMYCALNVRVCVCCIQCLVCLNDGAGGLFCGVGWPVGGASWAWGLANQHCGNQPISAL